MEHTRKAGAQSLLLVEDDLDLANHFEAHLSQAGFHVQAVRDGRAAVKAARQDAPDLVVLDKHLPGLSGDEVLRRIREFSDIPVLMLTADDELNSKVAVLGAGANDYIVKPVHAEELVARIRVHLELSGRTKRTRYRFGDLGMDLDAHTVALQGQEVHLTSREFALLRYLVERLNRVVPKSQIMAELWGGDFEGDDNIVEVFVRRLRQKLERDRTTRLIHTVRGVGYIFKHVA